MQGADRLGWDSLLLNEHHQTSHAMSPVAEPDRRPSLAATTENAAIALCGNSLALYNPPIRVAEELGDARLPLRRPGDRRDGVRHADGHARSATGSPPIELRDRFYEARELILRAWAAHRAVRFQRQVHQAALRQPVAAPDPAAELPIWIPGSRQRRDLGPRQRVRLLLRVPLVLRQAGGAADRQRVLGLHRAARREHEPAPHGVHAGDLLRADTRRGGGERSTPTRCKYFYRQNPVAVEFATPPGYRPRRRPREALRRAQERVDGRTAPGEPRRADFWEYDELGYIIAGTPRAGGAARARAGHRPAHRPADHLHAHRQPARGGRGAEQRSCSGPR